MEEKFEFTRLLFDLVVSTLNIIIFCAHAVLSSTWTIVIWSKLNQLKKQRNYFHKSSLFDSEALNK